MSAPTIFLVATHGFAMRVWLHTSLARDLLAAGAKVVVLSPNAAEPEIQTEYGGQGVELETLHTVKYKAFHLGSRLALWCSQMRAYVLNGQGDLATIDDLYRIYRRERPKSSIKDKLRNLLFDTGVGLLRRSALAAQKTGGTGVRALKPPNTTSTCLTNTGPAWWW